MYIIQMIESIFHIQNYFSASSLRFRIKFQSFYFIENISTVQQCSLPHQHFASTQFPPSAQSCVESGRLQFNISYWFPLKLSFVYIQTYKLKLLFIAILKIATVCFICTISKNMLCKFCKTKTSRILILIYFYTCVCVCFYGKQGVC